MTSHAISAADRRFQSALETGTLPPAAFDHRAHLRIAYIYLVDYREEEAAQRMQDSILGLLRHNGIAPDKYHETLTRAWILAVRHFMARTADCACADAFIDRNPEMLDSRIMLSHYSAGHLFSAEARASFVEPDLEAIPRYPPRAED